MPSHAIRPAGPKDLYAVQRIYAHHVRTGTASFEREAPDLDEIRRRFEAVRAMGAPYLVGEVGGEVKGFAYAGAFRARWAYRFTVEDSIHVDPQASGHGLGGALLGALITACEDAGFRQMVAVIGGSDNQASIRLHERLGFHLVGTLKATGHKFDAWVDTVIMQRALNQGDP